MTKHFIGLYIFYAKLIDIFVNPHYYYTPSIMQFNILSIITI